MNISICNVPLMPDRMQTRYPPLGALAIVQSIRRCGHKVEFFDINCLRPAAEETRRYFASNSFDVIGISATVSTSYAYVKNLVSVIRSVSPQSIIVVGGALAASAEVILKFNDVDYCVVGEGEKVVVNLLEYISSHGTRKEEDELRMIRGICFTGNNGEAIFTGYEEQLTADEIEDPDYGLLEKMTRLDNYIIDPFFYEQFKYDERSFSKGRKHKKLATVVTSRGCVNRCTFCYRWQKGIRIFPVDRVISNIRMLVERYDVGFISFGDEDFGASKQWLEEFIDKIGPLKILYRIAGICCDNVNLELLKRLRESGCVSVHYGFESGSDDILTVMEKRADADTNRKIAEMTHKAGLQTVVALVVGMPGESYGTIRETMGFVNDITVSLPKEPIISINALVVLPGTPVYEYARYRGLLGRTLEDEEKYLIRISGHGGGSTKQLNLTDYPYFIVQGWVRCISIAARYNYRRRNNLPMIGTASLLYAIMRKSMMRGHGAGYPAKELYGHPLFYRLNYLISPAIVMYKSYKEDKGLFLERCIELLTWPFSKKSAFRGGLSLRRYLVEDLKYLDCAGGDSVRALRLGR